MILHLPVLIFPCKILVSAKQGVLGKQGFCVFRNYMHIFITNAELFSPLSEVYWEMAFWGFLQLGWRGVAREKSEQKEGSVVFFLPALELTEKRNWSSQAEQAKIQARQGYSKTLHQFRQNFERLEIFNLSPRNS